MGSLSASFAPEDNQSSEMMCSFARLRASLDDDDREVLDSWLDSKPNAFIVARLRKAGHPIGEATVSYHKRGACICG